MPPKARPSLTHFLCLPLVTPQSLPSLGASLQQLSDDVSHPTSEMQGGDYAGRLPCLPTASVRPPTTLHLTLGVLSLDAARLEAARTHLRALDLWHLLRQAQSGTDGAVPDTESKQLSPPPLVVRLQGMKPLRNASSTTVVFAEPVDASGRLTRFCNQVRQSFVDADLMVPDRELLLHATLLNTIYAPKGPKHQGDRQQGAGARERHDAAQAGEAARTEAGSVEEGPETSGGGRLVEASRPKGKRRFKSRPVTFDARGLCEKWKDALWAEVTLETLAICEMGAKPGEDGMLRYAEVESKEFH